MRGAIERSVAFSSMRGQIPYPEKGSDARIPPIQPDKHLVIRVEIFHAAI
jgi:hypothetical protein